MAYNKETQANYNSKCLQFKAQYRLLDITDGQRLKAYLEQTGQSANSYIKALIKADLDSKGFILDDDTKDIDSTDTKDTKDDDTKG